MKFHPKSGMIVSWIFFLILGGILWYLTPRWEIQDNETMSIRQSGYNFINPLLECETSTTWNNQKYIPFEKELIRKIEGIESSHSGTHISVYFRNLRNGPWFGVNENADFSPASLMKLPIFLMYLKWSEKDPSILKQTITITGENSMPQNFPPEIEVQNGSWYTVSDLLFHLIVYSDNLASNNLLAYIPEEIQNMVFTDLNIPLPKDVDYTLSVKEYASFFRMLYNASYLSREDSELALQTLSQAKFHGGITGKIPNNVVVAHKFGEREMLDASGNTVNQLHDCGIVYYTPYPYLVCIMSRGDTDINTLSNIIQDTSKTIYDEVSNKYPE